MANEWTNAPEEGWTVRTLVKALTNYELDTPIYTVLHTDFGLENTFSLEYCEKEREDSPNPAKKGPLIVLT